MRVRRKKKFTLRARVDSLVKLKKNHFHKKKTSTRGGLDAAVRLSKFERLTIQRSNWTREREKSAPVSSPLWRDGKCVYVVEVAEKRWEKKFNEKRRRWTRNAVKWKWKSPTDDFLSITHFTMYNVHKNISRCIPGAAAAMCMRCVVERSTRSAWGNLFWKFQVKYSLGE